MKKVIGLSLSFCVKDILSGDVPEQDVECVVASTRARNEQDWDEVIARYRQVYWVSDPDRGEAICRRLLAAGKIQQPRLQFAADDRTARYPDISERRWAESLEDIPWRNDCAQTQYMQEQTNEE